MDLNWLPTGGALDELVKVGIHTVDACELLRQACGAGEIPAKGYYVFLDWDDDDDGESETWEQDALEQEILTGKTVLGSAFWWYVPSTDWGYQTRVSDEQGSAFVDWRAGSFAVRFTAHGAQTLQRAENVMLDRETFIALVAECSAPDSGWWHRLPDGLRGEYAPAEITEVANALPRARRKAGRDRSISREAVEAVRQRLIANDFDHRVHGALARIKEEFEKYFDDPEGRQRYPTPPKDTWIRDRAGEILKEYPE